MYALTLHAVLCLWRLTMDKYECVTTVLIASVAVDHQALYNYAKL